MANSKKPAGKGKKPAKKKVTIDDLPERKPAASAEVSSDTAETVKGGVWRNGRWYGK